MINWEKNQIEFYSNSWDIEDFRGWVVNNYPFLMKSHRIKVEAGTKGLKSRFDWRSIANKSLLKLYILQNISKGVSLAEQLEEDS